MVSRRELLSGGALAGLMGTAAGAGDSSDQTSQERDLLQNIADTLGKISTDLNREAGHWGLFRSGNVAFIRDAQKLHLKANGRFPGWIDVGVDIWMDLYDWHVANRQPLVVQRTPDGRYYTLTFCYTAVVLRHDNLPTYVGMPYDER